MEGWEDQIDVDDSDLHSVLRFQLSSSSSSPQSLPHHLRPCSKIPSSQTFKPISSISCSQPLPCTHNSHKNQNEEEEHPPKFFTTRFRIPGPAGAIQAAMRRNSAICASKRSLLEEGGSDDLDLCVKEDDGDFMLDAWLYSLSFIGKAMDSSLPYPISLINAERCATKRIPQVVGIVKSCTPNGLGDLFVTLKDPTGTIGAAIHRKTLSEGNICGEISVGCVFILKQVVAFCPAHSSCYLNITLKNVVKLIAKDCGPPEKQLMPTSTFMFGAEWNGKQLPAELSEGDRSFNSRKIAKVTADVEPSRSFTCEKTTNSRKEFHPANLPGNTFAAAIASVNTTAKPVKPATIMGQPRRLISKASVTEWTDEQLEKLFSEYEDDVELVRPGI